jgi:hypothetical protein
MDCILNCHLLTRCDRCDSWTSRPCQPYRGECYLFPMRYGVGYLLHHPHLPVSNLLSIFRFSGLATLTSHPCSRRVYQHHPEVNFKPGPFYMGDGLLGWAANITCIVWTCFIVVIFSFPTVRPVTAENMNYAAVITVGVVVLSGYVVCPDLTFYLNADA